MKSWSVGGTAGLSGEAVGPNSLSRNYSRIWNTRPISEKCPYSRRQYVTKATSDSDIQPPRPSRRTGLAVAVSLSTLAAAPLLGVPELRSQAFENFESKAVSIDIPQIPLAPDLQVSRVRTAYARVLTPVVNIWIHYL